MNYTVINIVAAVIALMAVGDLFYLSVYPQ
jgi:hypothetical protein